MQLTSKPTLLTWFKLLLDSAEGGEGWMTLPTGGHIPPPGYRRSGQWCLLFLNRQLTGQLGSVAVCLAHLCCSTFRVTRCPGVQDFQI